MTHAQSGLLWTSAIPPCEVFNYFLNLSRFNNNLMNHIIPAFTVWFSLGSHVILVFINQFSCSVLIIHQSFIVISNSFLILILDLNLNFIFFLLLDKIVIRNNKANYFSSLRERWI